MKNKRNIDKLISRAINETMSEKADELVKSLNELGGMSPDSQDTEHPFYNLGPNASRKEINRIMKDYYGKEDYMGGEEDEDEEEFSGKMSRNAMAKMKDDETDDWNEIDIEGIGDEENYEEMEEGFDDYEMKGWRGGKDYSEKEFEKIPLGKGKVGFPSEEDFDDETGSSMERFIKKRFKGYRDEDNDEDYELTEGEVCEQCGAKGSINEGEVCEQCGYKKSEMEESIIITSRSNVKNFKPPVTDLEEEDFTPSRSNIKTNMTSNEEFMENIYDVEDLGDSEFDYVETQEEEFYDEESDYDSPKSMEDEYIKRTKEACDPNSINYNKESCEYHKNNFDGGELSEKLYGNQHKLDHNKNGRIDSEDLRMARSKGKHKKGGETDEQWQGALLGAAEAALPYVAPAATEWALDKMFGGESNESVQKRKKGKKFPDLSGDGKVTRKDILMGRGVKLGKDKKKIKESIQLTENEIIDLIENIVLEEKSNLKKGAKHKGTTTYEKAHKGSGKENEDYIKSVTKKMKDYLKDGSKGGFDMNPKMFPKGNGELAKMSKKAYKPSQAIQDYTDNLTAAGLENLDYDEIHPNEDWVNDLMVGSSKTGNNPEWANAVDTGVNKKRRKVQKDNILSKIKRKAYNKAPQPVISDKTGEDSGVNKLMAKLESVEPKKTEKLNEEFDRMKELLGYNRKTQ